jgi:amidohydrolase
VRWPLPTPTPRGAQRFRDKPPLSTSARRHPADLHAHPEIGHREHRTTGLIVDQLERAGLVVKVLPVGTGAYCDVLPGGFDDSSGLVGLRADIDALPIADGKDVDYASKNPGVCHACGHDVHTAILLGVGIVLSRLRDLDLLTRGVG